MKKLNALVLLSIIVCISNSCLPKITPYRTTEHFTSDDGEPDYSQLDYWAAHPLKKDPSDSLRKGEKISKQEKLVDVFFLYPTSYTDNFDGFQSNAKIDDRYINKKTDFTSILYQASIYNKDCKVYAPRYRQAHISMYYSKDSILVKKAFDLAYQDVKKAFDYFLTHLNGGRPFIIASHSQGTTHALRLIKECLDGDKYSKKFIVAYLIGMPVEKNSFSKIPVCFDSTKIGCFVSWRTYQRGYMNEYLSLEDSSVAVVNPLSWKPDKEMIGSEYHKGAVLYNFNKLVKETHSAQVIGNGLFISKPKFWGSFLIRMKNYHAGDYNLFYQNVVEDVSRRIKNYYQLEN